MKLSNDNENDWIIRNTMDNICEIIIQFRNAIEDVYYE